MVGLSQYALWLWAFNVAVELAILVSMAARKNFRQFPFFFSYIFLDLVQSAALVTGYVHWGFAGALTERFAWGTQAIVLCARALAVGEICWHVLGQYSGVWGLVRRILVLCAAGIAVYSIYWAGWKWDQTVLRAEIGLELAISVVIVVLFLFARYYEIIAEPAVRALAIGFLLFSSFRAVNDTILVDRLARYENLWRLLAILAFSASVCLWLSVLRKPLPASAKRPAMLSGEIYRTLTPEVNLRLRRLNEQLSKLGNARERRS